MAERDLKTRAPNSQSSSLPTRSCTSSGLTLGRQLCAFFQPLLLLYGWASRLPGPLGHHWEGFSRRGSWRAGAVPWTLAWTNQLSLAPAPPFVARETLRAWQEKNHPWLELSDVHRETTENIRVTVIPFYMGMRVCAQAGSLSSGLGPHSLWCPQCDCWSKFQI